MAKFITGNDLEKAICDIIWEAKETLLIVSPFIKLDEFFITHFKHHINNYDLHLLIVFGKNEKDVSRSLNKSDFEFFKNFQNVSIIYEPNLHAKYYGNEKSGIITSVNLYDASFKQNIEFGVLTEINLLNKFTNNADQDAWNKCTEIAASGEVVFIKRPSFKRNLLMMKKYIKSEVLFDNTEYFYSTSSKSTKQNKKINDFPDEVDCENSTEIRPTRETMPIKEINHLQQNNAGYCIRTGIPIPFNVAKPFCIEAYNSWNRFGNRDYREKYCHFSGELSNGETSFNYPILSKYEQKARQFHGLK